MNNMKKRNIFKTISLVLLIIIGSILSGLGTDLNRVTLLYPGISMVSIGMIWIIWDAINNIWDAINKG